MSGELSNFEQQSALVPKTAPYAILGGAVLAVIFFILVSTFSKNEAVEDLAQKGQDAASSPAPAAAPADAADDAI